MRHTILVVDDEASIADGLRLTLEAEGYSVRIAGSVRTALASVAQSDPHVAIVDLMLPDGDGLVLTRELKQRDPALEVVVTADGFINIPNGPGSGFAVRTDLIEKLTVRKEMVRSGGASA